MNARELMQAADALTGVKPGMSAEEIRRRQDITPERLKMVYLIQKYNVSSTSHDRGETREAITLLVDQFPHLGSLADQALAGRVSITREPKGRPSKHASDLIARREASRAYRARQKGKP